MGKKELANLLSLVSIISPILLIYSGSILYVAFDESFYHKEFEKLNVYSALSSYDINAINQKVLQFLSGKNNELPGDFFTQREISHLQDVEEIFSIIISTFFISLVSLVLSFAILILIIRDKRIMLRFFDRIFLMAALIVIAINLILILALNVDFGASFDIFHKSFFNEGSYLFSPLSEKIVVLYPEQMFYDGGIRILKYSFSISLIIVLMGITVYALERWKLKKSL